MKAGAFTEQRSGELVPTISGQLAFVPTDLPPVLDMAQLALPMAEAMQAIGELRGACRRLRNPYFLIRPLQRREALTSSPMEGTFTTADNLILAEAGVERDQDDSTREVINYLRALNRSLQLLESLPICHRVIKAAHEILLSGLSSSRGAQKRPGDYKVEQNWIGGRTIEVARYVPPPPPETQSCMDALEVYINREHADTASALIDLALVHYQLEAIHPFADGNGRVGRMIISLMAVKGGLLEMPVLYMSPALERDKDSYIDLMFNVSASGQWTEWITFFFAKVAESARETIETIDRLISLQEEYRQMAGSAMRSSNILTLVDMLFEQPAISVGDAKEKLGVTYAAAKKTIDKLIELGILGDMQGTYPKYYVARGIMAAALPNGS